ncbi:MAG: hypothetical protein M3467_12490, partial [Actinomycetota bacterium]|nr:hypothetical protein [Actinomycetota bacterium]
MPRRPATGAVAVPAETAVDVIADRYTGVVLDVDGVLVRLQEPIDGAAETVAALRRRGLGLAFVTNNASRRPAEVAERLAALGIPATAREVVTSAQAAVRVVGAQVPAGAAVLV